VTPQKVDYHVVLPEIDEEKCNGCRICVDLGHCEVMGYENKKAKVAAPDKCYYCAVCYWLCPKQAITMVPAEQ
jgi:NAD-dependent dihydropyrimidine dehydrogenase PreA subunit